MPLPVAGETNWAGKLLGHLNERLPPAPPASRQSLRINADGDPFWVPSGVYAPEDYGAVADSTTDNATAFAALAAAVNAVPNTDGIPVAIIFTGNADGAYYRYSGGLAFTRPVVLVGVEGAGLNYTGSGYAVKLGPDGLDDTNYHLHRRYIVAGLQFTGGASYTHGLYFNDHIVEPRVLDCMFLRFGNSTGFAVFFQADNWDALMRGCDWYTPSTDSAGRNWVRVRGYHEGNPSGHSSVTNGTADNGNSRLRMIDCHGTNLNTGGGTGSGVGVWLNGANNQVRGCKLEGFEPNVRFGAWANRSLVSESYFEIVRINATQACIEFGDPSGGDLPTADLQGLRIVGNYANCHNDDSVNIDAYFAAYTQSGAGLKDCTFDNNMLTGYDATREMVLLPNQSGQTGNRASGNLGIGKVHTTGGSIDQWGGEQGARPQVGGRQDAATYLKLVGGATTNQNAGIEVYAADGTTLRGRFLYSTGANQMIVEHVGGSKSATLDVNGHWTAPGRVIGATGVQIGSTSGPKWITGAGSPEGSIAGNVGDLYSRTGGGAGTTLYVKESGTGTTGWVAK